MVEMVLMRFLSSSELNGQIVDVYYNLRKKLFSVRFQGRVAMHSHSVFLKHCQFRVSEKGRQRVLREKRKNVHAYVTGIFCESNPMPPSATMRRVTYNPYKWSTFVEYYRETPITSCLEAWLTQKQIFVSNQSHISETPCAVS